MGRDVSVLYWHGTVNLVPTQGSPVFGTGSLVYGILFHRDSQTAPRGVILSLPHCVLIFHAPLSARSAEPSQGHRRLGPVPRELGTYATASNERATANVKYKTTYQMA